MYIIAKRLHVRKFAVGMTVALCVTLALPGVVDINVDVPASRIPLATIASAAARTSESVTLSEKWFQLFQPMGGVEAKCWDWPFAVGEDLWRL